MKRPRGLSSSEEEGKVRLPSLRSSAQVTEVFSNEVDGDTLLKRMDVKEMERRRQILPHLDEIHRVQIFLDSRLERDGSEKRMIDVVDEKELPSKRGEAVRLLGKFPRFCAKMRMKDFKGAKKQTLHWLLQMIEDIYDARCHLDSLRGYCTVPFPKTAFDHLCQTYGSAANQQAIDLLVTIEFGHFENHQEFVQLFADFLGESLDADALHVYVSLRSLMENLFKFKFSHASTQILKQDVRSGLTVVKKVCMMDEVVLRGSAIRIAVKIFIRDQLCVKGDVSSLCNFLVSKINSKTSARQFLAFVLKHYREMPDEIVKHVKFGDDGKGIEVLDRLQHAQNYQKKIAKIENNLDKARVEELSERALIRNLVHNSKLSKENEAKNRTSLFLRRNELKKKTQVVKDLEKQLEEVNTRIEKAWFSVMHANNYSLDFKTEHISSMGLRMYRAFLFQEVEHKHMKEAVARQLRNRLNWRQDFQNKKENAALLLQRHFRRRRLRARKDSKANESAASSNSKKGLEEEENEDQLKNFVAEKLAAKRNSGTIRKYGDVKLQRMFKMNESSLIQFTFNEWNHGIASNRLARRAKCKRLLKLFAMWRANSQVQALLRDKKKSAAAEIIQATARMYLFRDHIDKLKERRRLLNIYSLKISNRLLGRTFAAWVIRYKLLKHSKSLMLRTLKGRLKESFKDWKVFQRNMIEEKRDSAVIVQSFVRRTQARSLVAKKRIESIAIVRIQSAWRKFCCRKVVERARVQLEKEEQMMKLALWHIENRLLFATFSHWKVFMTKRRLIKAILEEKMGRAMRESFHAWNLFRETRKMQKALAAVKIQANFRRLVAERNFRSTIRQRKMATHIQAMVRGRKCRIEVEVYYWRVQSCIRLQRIWRGRIGRKIFMEKLSKYVLENANKENIHIVRFALEVKKIPPETLRDPETGDTLLHRGVRIGSKRVIKLCLRHGIDVNVVNFSGRNVLHELNTVVFPGQALLADYLMGKGANLRARDVNGETPFLQACAKGLLSLVDLYLPYSVGKLEEKDVNGNTALHLAVFGGHAQVAHRLIAFGADQFCQDWNGAHPLHDLASKGDLEMMKTLIPYFSGEGGLDLRDNEERTPLFYAVVDRRHNAVEMLLQWGATPEVTDMHGRNPAWFATRSGDLQMLELLLESECNSSARCMKTGDTTLHNASRLSGDQALVFSRFLLKNGADCNIQNQSGDLPLHMAARENNVEVFHLLLHYDCDINLKNFDGHTPLGVARMSGAGDIVNYIKRRYIEMDLQEKWEFDERRKAEALVALLGQMKFINDQKFLNRSRTIATEIYMEKGEQFELTEEFLSEEQSELELEMGSLTDSPWQRYRFLNAREPRCFWYNPKTHRLSWAIPQEIFDLPEAVDQWTQRWNDEKQQLEFVNETDGRLISPSESSMPPRARGGKFLMKRDSRSPVKKTASTKALDDAVLDNDMQDVEGVNLSDYKKFWEEENKEIRLRLQQDTSAMLIQRLFRSLLARKHAEMLRLENEKAALIQASWRAVTAFRRTKDLRRQSRACRVIQRAWKSFAAVKWFFKNKDILMEEKTICIACNTIHRVWCGYLARRHVRRLYARRIDPAPRTADDWQVLMESGNAKLIREMAACREYLLRWPDVYFYTDTNNVASFVKPKALEKVDHAEFIHLWGLVKRGYTLKDETYALKLQNFFRSKKIRDSFRITIRAVRIVQAAENAYMEHPFRSDDITDRQGIVNLCNYMLYLFAVEHDFGKARGLFRTAMEYMMRRGPDNAFVLMSNAIFLASRREEDDEVILDFVWRAHVADPWKRKFKLAEAIFFRQAVIEQPNNARALLNYALCLQFKANPDLDLAEQNYLEALRIDPHNHHILENLQFMLKRLKEADYAAFDAFQNFMEGINERERSSATRIQAWARSFLARFNVRAAVLQEWEIAFDEEFGHEYYCSRVSGQSVWKPPFGFHFPAPKWEMFRDEEGNVFFFDHVKGESTWAVT